MKNKSILVISDLHIPYHHPDAFVFLAALKKKYKFDRIINIGDEVDNHSISYHEHDPDLAGPNDELTEARRYLKTLEKMFPNMDIISSNHGSLYSRKLKTAGLPKAILKSMNDIYNVGKGWVFHRELILKLPTGEDCLFVHGMSAQGVQASQDRGINLVQGHFHTKFNITYWRSSRQLSWGMTVGCLVDRETLAFEYAREGKKMQIIGCGGIIDGYPRLFPMKLNAEGRWTGEVC